MRIFSPIIVISLFALISLSCAEFKQAGRDIGHGTRDATRAIGHGTRDVVKSVKKDIHDATE